MTIKGTRTIDIGVPPDQVMEVALDIESYPDWNPGWRKAVVVERDDNGRPATVERVLFNWKELNQTLCYGWGEGSVAWDLVSGDGKESSGEWKFTATGGGTRVEYSVAIDPGVPIPDLLLKPNVRKAVDAELQALKARCEGKA